jgi:precorrin-6A/cobalt-precorrin-6A reductase
MTRVLVLAGSAEGTALARRLHDEGARVVASFAGRVRDLPTLPCATRVGGFGGVGGLVEELAGYDGLVDACHPYAAQMAHHAWRAAQETGVPHVKLLRPPWVAEQGDDWHEVADLDAAAAWLSVYGIGAALLATGRHEVEPFAALEGTRFVLRSIEPPGPLPLTDATVVLARGPFDVDSERDLLVRHGVQAIVTRNSGGTGAAAKLVAARDLGLPVVMVRRPDPPAGAATVETVEDAAAWVRESGVRTPGGRR